MRIDGMNKSVSAVIPRVCFGRGVLAAVAEWCLTFYFCFMEPSTYVNSALPVTLYCMV